jgi:hypothetical protein
MPRLLLGAFVISTGSGCPFERLQLTFCGPFHSGAGQKSFLRLWKQFELLSDKIAQFLL